MTEYNFLDGVIMSLFSMIIVFIILSFLAFIISLSAKFISKQTPTKTEKKSENRVNNVLTNDDDEELLVAKIVASCHFQKRGQTNVMIKNTRRIK